MFKMIILALDIASKTGWAVIDENGKIIRSGTEVFKDKERGAKLSSFMSWLSLVCSTYSPSCIIAEKPFFRGSGTRLLMPMVGIAELMASRSKAAFLEVSNVTIKKHLTGNARAEKEEMIKAIQDKGYSPTDDNEADAIALALYAFEKIEIGQ